MILLISYASIFNVRVHQSAIALIPLISGVEILSVVSGYRDLEGLFLEQDED